MDCQSVIKTEPLSAQRRDTLSITLLSTFTNVVPSLHVDINFSHIYLVTSTFKLVILPGAILRRRVERNTPINHIFYCSLGNHKMKSYVPSIIILFSCSTSNHSVDIADTGKVYFIVHHTMQCKLQLLLF